MPRRPRIHLPGLPLHVVQRGHNRDACFFAEEDYLAYREWLGEACKATGCALHAYVQMTNHVHLLLCPPESEAVSRLMISLGRRYVQPSRRHPVGQPLQVFPGAGRCLSTSLSALYRTQSRAPSDGR